MLVRAKSLQSCPTLCDPHGLCVAPARLLRPWDILQARILEWVAMPSSRETLVLAAMKLGEPQGNGSDLQGLMGGREGNHVLRAPRRTENMALRVWGGLRLRQEDEC